MDTIVDNEQVDIVNEQDRILYSTSKIKAHQDGLLHRCVIAEVINSKSEWLMVQQSSDRQEPGKLVSPMGGHVSSGESNEDALKREMIEELGISTLKYKYIGKCIYNVEVLGRRENHYFIVFEVHSDQEPVLSHEAQSYKRFTKEELKKALKQTPEIFGNAFFPIVDNLYPDLIR